MVQKYLYRRGNVFYFRWVVPNDLRDVIGRSEIKQTLRCLEFSQAALRSGSLALHVSHIKNLRKLYLSEVLGRDEYLQSIRSHFHQILPVHSEKPDFKAKKGMLFSQLFREFLSHKCDPVVAQKEHRSALSERQQNEHRRHYESILAAMGDMPVKEISTAVARNALLACGAMPKKNLKKYKGIVVKQLLDMEIPKEDRIQPKTHLGIKKTFQGILRYGVYKDYLSRSPLDGVRLQRTSQKTFAAFTDSEIQGMLSACRQERHVWQKWLVLLAAYTGARRGELVQIRKQDVKFDPETKRHYLLITEAAGKVKTLNANRQIPIHKRLVESGFLDYVSSTGEKLFPELTAKAVTRWFTAFRDRQKIPQIDDYGNSKVFHSFRHTFVTKARGSGISVDLIQQVVGHEKVKTGVTDRYSHNQPLKVVMKVVDCIDYSVQ